MKLLASWIQPCLVTENEAVYLITYYGEAAPNQCQAGCLLSVPVLHENNKSNLAQILRCEWGGF